MEFGEVDELRVGLVGVELIGDLVDGFVVVGLTVSAIEMFSAGAGLGIVDQVVDFGLALDNVEEVGGGVELLEVCLDRRAISDLELRFHH